MTVTRINLSQDYKQDEHQRMQAHLADGIDLNATRGNYTECRLGFVYVNSVTAKQTQQCIETQILVNGSGVGARYYWTQMPFAGSVASLQVDCTASLAAPHTVTLYQNQNAIAQSVLTVGTNAQGSIRYYAKNAIPFKAGDKFYAVVTFPVAVSSTFYCGFIKMYVQLGV